MKDKILVALGQSVLGSESKVYPPEGQEAHQVTNFCTLGYTRLSTRTQQFKPACFEIDITIALLMMPF